MSEELEIKEEKKSNIVHILLYTLLAGGLSVSLYLNYIYSNKTAPKPIPVSQCNSFASLPVAIQDQYIEFNAYNELKTANAQLEMDLNASKITVTTNEIPVDRPTNVTKVKDFAKCYTMDNASHKIPKVCRKNFTDYVDKYPDAKYFEIIGIVDNLEFNLFNNLENNKALYKKLRVDQRIVDKMKKLARRGLSKERASEASWVIKAYTKQKAATYNANYELVSEKGYRGVVIRAYK